MKRKAILLLLSFYNTNIFAFDVLAEYSVECIGNNDKDGKTRKMSISETPEELFNFIMNSANDINSRSHSRDMSEERNMLYFISCSVSKDNQTRGFASILTSDDLKQTHNNSPVARRSVGSPVYISTNVSNLRENISRICDDIKVDYTYMRTSSPFDN